MAVAQTISWRMMTQILANRSSNDASSNQPSTCGDANCSVAFYVALLEREMPDLAAVVKAWNHLRPAVKAGIVAMVKAAQPKP